MFENLWFHENGPLEGANVLSSKPEGNCSTCNDAFNFEYSFKLFACCGCVTHQKCHHPDTCIDKPTIFVENPKKIIENTKKNIKRVKIHTEEVSHRRIKIKKTKQENQLSKYLVDFYNEPKTPIHEFDFIINWMMHS